ncbi:MAG: hypothetical protein M1823_000568 [Watsoniomyces obsoletus]|nr:MAG: hypothetical protein M1823_000568 [Watsoniomyces obsoletus]
MHLHSLVALALLGLQSTHAVPIAQAATEATTEPAFTEVDPYPQLGQKITIGAPEVQKIPTEAPKKETPPDTSGAWYKIPAIGAVAALVFERVLHFRGPGWQERKLDDFRGRDKIGRYLIKMNGPQKAQLQHDLRLALGNEKAFGRLPPNMLDCIVRNAVPEKGRIVNLAVKGVYAALHEQCEKQQRQLTMPTEQDPAVVKEAARQARIASLEKQYKLADARRKLRNANGDGKRKKDKKDDDDDNKPPGGSGGGGGLAASVKANFFEKAEIAKKNGALMWKNLVAAPSKIDGNTAANLVLMGASALARARGVPVSPIVAH